MNKEESGTALHLAIKDNNLQAVIDIISSGADIEKENNYGHTPLHHAVDLSHKEIVHYLLDHKANPKSYSKGSQHAIHTAVARGDYDIVKMLLKAGADPKVKVSGGIYKGWDCLQGVSEFGSSKMAKLLIEHGATVNSKNINKETPLIIATQQRNKAVLKILMRAGADLSHKSKEGISVKEIAKLNGIESTLNELIKERVLKKLSQEYSKTIQM